MVTCTDCGFTYGEHEACCPKCGNPTHRSNVRTDISNCPCCGAPVTGSEACDYCGAMYPKPVVYQQPRPVQQPQKQDDTLNVVAAVALGAIVGGIFSD